jgi:hypothetical protein
LPITSPPAISGHLPLALPCSPDRAPPTRAASNRAPPREDPVTANPDAATPASVVRGSDGAQTVRRSSGAGTRGDRWWYDASLSDGGTRWTMVEFRQLLLIPASSLPPAPPSPYHFLSLSLTLSLPDVLEESQGPAVGPPEGRVGNRREEL